MILASVALLVAACGLFQEEEEYICEPPADSQWIATATPTSGNCPQDWVDLGRNELVGRTLIYEDEGLECGVNDLERTNSNYNCEVTIDEDPVVSNGQLNDDYVSFTVECPDGTRCFQGYDVEYFRAPDENSDSSTDTDQISEQISGKYWDASFDSDWRPGTFAWNQMELVDSVDRIFAYVHLRRDGTYTYVENFGYFDGSATITHQSGAWEVNGDTITISDGCSRQVSHSVSLNGETMRIGAIEWTHRPGQNENNFSALMHEASEDCTGHLSPENPQKR
jgi:hypothetical protein